MGHRFCWCLLMAAMVLAAPAARAAEPMHLEVILVWGTDQTNSPDPKHVPVDALLARKLGQSPYRWKHYFEVNRQLVIVPEGASVTNVTVSRHCVLDISNLGTNRSEIKLYGQGRLVSTHNELLTENWPLILAGPAGNQTAWMVVIRRIKPVPPAISNK